MRTPHDNPPDWMAVLTAYIDESGFGSRDIIVLGGFIGTDDQWILCGEKWKEALGRKKALHMKKLRWKDTASIEPLLGRLGPVPHDCGLIPTWVRFKVSDYSDLLESTAVSRKLQNGYFMAAQYLGLILLNYAQRLDERIKIVFEHNDQFAKVLPTVINLYGIVYPFLTRDGKRCMSGVEMIAKNSSSLTQPADFLAYARLQQLRDQNSERARLCLPIINPQPGVYVDIGRDDIRKHMSSPSQKRLRELGRQLEPMIKKARNKR